MKKITSIRAIIPSWERFCSLQDIWQHFETFLSFITGALLYLVGRGQECFHISYQAPDSPITKNYLAQNIIVQKLRNHAWDSAVWDLALREGTWLSRITRVSWSLLIPNPLPFCLFIAGFVAPLCISRLLGTGFLTSVLCFI